MFIEVKYLISELEKRSGGLDPSWKIWTCYIHLVWWPNFKISAPPFNCKLKPNYPSEPHWKIYGYRHLTYCIDKLMKPLSINLLLFETLNFTKSVKIGAWNYWYTVYMSWWFTLIIQWSLFEDTCWNVYYSNSTVCLVYMLSSCTTGPKRFHPEVIRINSYVHLSITISRNFTN